MHAVERGSFQIWSYSRSRFLGASFKLLFVSLELLQKRFVSKLLLNSVPQLIPVVSELVSRPVSVGATLKGGFVSEELLSEPAAGEAGCGSWLDAAGGGEHMCASGQVSCEYTAAIHLRPFKCFVCLT